MDVRAKLSTHFSSRELSAHPQGWDDLWVEGFIPWDKGFPSPALVDLLQQRKDLFPKKKVRKKALVPGCGKGYDVLLLSAFGYDAYGLDFSGNALKEARAVEEQNDGNRIYETREGETKGKVTWVVGDFFKDEFLGAVEGVPKFDLIYDYTFLSALPPSLRAGWASRNVELLAPEGRLVCLEFPTRKLPSTGGPPWALPPEVYMAHLPRPGKDLPYADDGEILEAKIGEPSVNGLNRLEHFQPQRTHEIGYSDDGKVTDWISIWAHPNR
ncbi:S-adenosyl-L-methionine-dependent methyltransferase [Bisporella sp. PMI_857]|nr:S-adenosyl-L-methionine-dependent methyltransferase [Bisporella sp. PMI_857]